MNTKSFKKFTRPLFSLLLCLTLIISLLTVSASAEDIDDTAQEDELRVFYMMNDESAIYDDNGIYKAYTLPVGYAICDNTAYVYATPIEAYDPYGNVSVYTPYEGSDLYWLDGAYYYDVIYMSDEALTEASSFFSGTYSSYALSDSIGRLASVSASERCAIEDSSNTRTVDVRDLVSLDRYDLYGYDSTGALYYTLGAIYVTDDEATLYIDYTTLPNNYFDSDGYFSYRSGTVTAAILNATGISTFNALMDELEYPDYSYTYEDGGFDDFDEIMLVLFWVLLIALGIVLPIIVIAISVFLPPFLEKKRQRRIMAYAGAVNGDTPPSEFTPEPQKSRAKRAFTPWSLAAILSGVWLLLGIAMLLILVL